MDNISSMEIDGRNVTTAARLEWLSSLVAGRVSALQDAKDRPALMLAEWQQAPAFEVHIRAGLQELVTDDECRMLLRRIVARGEEARVVVFLHEPLDDVSAALAPVSGFLVARLIASRSLRHAGAGGLAS
jgi:hypothetical protein